MSTSHVSSDGTKKARNPEDFESGGFAHHIFYSARQALQHHATGGNVLILATVLALVVANIPG